MLSNVLFSSKVLRNRFLLSGPNGYFTDDDGTIRQTTDPQKATPFVDVDVAAERGQALIDLGYEVISIIPYALQ